MDGLVYGCVYVCACDCTSSSFHCGACSFVCLLSLSLVVRVVVDGFTKSEWEQGRIAALSSENEYNIPYSRSHCILLYTTYSSLSLFLFSVCVCVCLLFLLSSRRFSMYNFKNTSHKNLHKYIAILLAYVFFSLFFFCFLFPVLFLLDGTFYRFFLFSHFVNARFGINKG